jgi:hypothetical protein
MSFGNIDDHVYYRYPSMSWYMTIGSIFQRLLEWNWGGDNMKMWIENEDGQPPLFYFSSSSSSSSSIFFFFFFFKKKKKEKKKNYVLFIYIFNRFVFFLL